MRMTTLGLFGFSLLFSVGDCGRSWAEEPIRDYVTTLQDQGFTDLALEYLEKREQEKPLPASLEPVLDFELAKAMQLHAYRADRERAEQLRRQATERYERFLSKPELTEERIEALSRLAQMRLEEGFRLLAQAEREFDKVADPKAKELKPEEQAALAKSNQLNESARQVLQKSQEGFAQAVKNYQEMLAKPLSELEPPPEKRNRAKTAQQQAEERKLLFQGALTFTEVQLGQATLGLALSHPEKSKERSAILKAAIDQFRDTYYRIRQQDLAVYPHLWHGRALFESGQYVDAIEIFKEVLIYEPPRASRKLSDVELDLLTQAELYLLKSYAALGEYEEIISESDFKLYSGIRWLKEHPTKREQESKYGWGIQLEVVRALLKAAEKLTGKNKDDTLREATVRLKRILNDSSHDYYSAAIRLRNQYPEQFKSLDQMNTFEEAFITANASLTNGDWESAVAQLEKALTLVTPSSPVDQVELARYSLASAQYQAGQVTAAATTASQLVRERPQGKYSPQAADLGLAAFFKLFLSATAADREAATQTFLNFADFVITTYKDLSVVAKAHMLTGFLQSNLKDFVAAGEAFNRVLPTADVYAESQYRAGLNYWQAYQLAQRKSASKPTAAQATSDLAATALKAFATAAAKLRETLEPKAPLPLLLMQAEVRWAEVAMQTGNLKKAEELLAPLVPLAIKEEREDFNQTRVDIFVQALRLAINQRDFKKSDTLVNELLAILAKGGRNTQLISAVLVQLGRGLSAEIEENKAAGNPKQAEQLDEAFRRFLDNLAKSNANNYIILSYIATAYFDLQDFQQAAAQYEKLLNFVKTSDDAVAADKKAGEVTRIQLRQSAALREAGQHAEALKIVDGLLADYQKSGSRTFPLLFELEKARTLHSWGVKDSAKLKEAIQQWGTIAEKLRTISKKPESYFEARYMIAECLQRGNNAAAAKQTLVSTMTLYPDCGGPKWKEQYQELLKKLQ